MAGATKFPPPPVQTPHVAPESIKLSAKGTIDVSEARFSEAWLQWFQAIANKLST